MTDELQPRPGISLRPATDADVEALFAIRTSVTENHMSRAGLARIGVTPSSVARMLRTNSAAWLAEANGEPVAFSMANAAEETVFAMFVRPGYEGLGLGRALMSCAEEWLFERGAPEIWLTTGGDPALRAHGFYRHLGWEEAGRTQDGQTKYVRRPEQPRP